MFAEQYSDNFEAELRKDFAAFYQKEVEKARKLQLTLVKKRETEAGDIQISADDKFIKVMQNYFD